MRVPFDDSAEDGRRAGPPTQQRPAQRVDVNLRPTRRRWLAWVLAVLAGAMTVAIVNWIAQHLGAGGVVILLCGTLLVAGGCAYLARTRWAALVIPVLYGVGFEVGALAQVSLGSAAYSQSYATQYLAQGAEMYARVYLLPVLVGAGLALVLAEKRRCTGK